MIEVLVIAATVFVVGNSVKPDDGKMSSLDKRRYMASCIKIDDEEVYCPGSFREAMTEIYGDRIKWKKRDTK